MHENPAIRQLVEALEAEHQHLRGRAAHMGEVLGNARKAAEDAAKVEVRGIRPSLPTSSSVRAIKSSRSRSPSPGSSSSADEASRAGRRRGGSSGSDTDSQDGGARLQGAARKGRASGSDSEAARPLSELRNVLQQQRGAEVGGAPKGTEGV